MSPSWLDDIRARLNRSWPDRSELMKSIAGEATLREAAVLVPLYVREKQLFTLFTKRTDHVEHHKGQVSFPGGGKEDEDTSLWATAVRETEEEIGVPSASVKHLGSLPQLVTVTSFAVTPFVGAIPYPITFQPHEREVESIIEVPLEYLMNPQVVEDRVITWKGREVPSRVYHYHGHAIWGVTAYILTDFLDALRDGS